MSTKKNQDVVVKYIYRYKYKIIISLIILENLNAHRKSGSAFKKYNILIKMRGIERKKRKKNN